MSDLVERLRSGNPGGDSTYPTIMTEAADRIQQLEAALREIRDLPYGSEGYSRVVARAALGGRT